MRSSSDSNPQLSGVSCSASNACTAVGYRYDSDGVDVTLAVRWNGAKWAIQSTPNPSSDLPTYEQFFGLTGVSCSSSADCTAVGAYYDSSGARVTLAEYWNGSRWVIQPTPNPSGAFDGGLNGVSCSSADQCTAAGFGGTLVEHWNGAKWAPSPLQTRPAASTASSTVCPVRRLRRVPVSATTTPVPT